jgi:pimeloyl-ACP methyl ester carboxylesterase
MVETFCAQIVVLGRSLGGAVALHLAADNPKAFKALVIENTFLSIEDVAPKVGAHS